MNEFFFYISEGIYAEFNDWRVSLISELAMSASKLSQSAVEVKARMSGRWLTEKYQIEKQDPGDPWAEKERKCPATFSVYKKKNFKGEMWLHLPP